MYARVVEWEGGELEAMRSAAAEMDTSNPPEGLPAKGFTMLVDPESGRSFGITVFETEDDYRQGDATLSGMNPPNDAFGKRVSVTKCEVLHDLRM